uniref:Alkyl transferase n=1 Tax=Lactuca sativa TaxID=4236 RepID=A0A9R1VMT5_LACSA|nr:hypothetical protein LSAT_V11C500274600 [Lactuca sativa]
MIITSFKEPIITPVGLHRELMLKHVEFIIDGNRRWDRSRGLMPQPSYLTCVGALKVEVDLCCKWGIQVLTVFAFSSNNWLRPKVEVDFLMRLLENTLKDEVASMDEIRVSVIGDVSKLPQSLRDFNITHCEKPILGTYESRWVVLDGCYGLRAKLHKCSLWQ